MPGPQGPQRGTRMGTILLKDSWQAHPKVLWSCLLHHCWPGQRVLAGHITPRFLEVHLYGLRHWTFPVQETPHGNNRCIGCISKEAGFHLHWTPRSHRHRWWHDYLWNHQRWAWPEPTSISTSHKRQILCLNKGKIQFKKTEVSFFGHRWSKDGLSLDPKKIQSIINMDFPEDKETMHSFLGMVNFLNRYSPRLAELCAPLRSLILKDTHYIVTDEHRAAFTQLKQEFTTEIMLPYFDRNKYTTLQMDASKKGFGAVILQDNKPIYFTSRNLTSAEKNYQNLEWECMAAIWGMEKFHFYLNSKEFLLQMDQKPLTSIFKKHLVDVFT